MENIFMRDLNNISQDLTSVEEEMTSEGQEIIVGYLILNNIYGEY